MGDWWNERFEGQVAFGEEKLPTIRKGTRGAAVSRWQGLIGLKPDGNFGKGTEAATKTWQEAHGLKPDGVVGPATWAAALGPGTTPVADQVIAPPQTVAEQVTRPPGTPKVAEVHPTIRLGSKGPAVKDWQHVLGLTPEDGNFGKGTKKSTQTFQKRAGLKPDGVVGPKTWMAAYASASANPSIPNAQTPPLQVVDSTNEFPPAPQPPPAVASTLHASAPVVRPPDSTVAIVTVTPAPDSSVSSVDSESHKKSSKVPWYLLGFGILGAGAVHVHNRSKAK